MGQMIIGDNEKTDGPLVSIASNSPYQISCSDPMLFDTRTAAPTSGGHLKYVTNTGTHTGGFLGAHAQVSINGNYHQLEETATVIRSGSAEQYSASIKVKQTVSITDPATNANNKLDVVLRITGGLAA